MMKNHQLCGKEQSLREPIMMDLLMSKVAIYNLIKIISSIGGEIIIDMNSIICTDIKDKGSNGYLVKHLKNDDFFATDKFPLSHLKIVNVTTDDNNNFKIKADLTIKEQTHPIEFTANIIYSNNVGLCVWKNRNR